MTARHQPQPPMLFTTVLLLLLSNTALARRRKQNPRNQNQYDTNAPYQYNICNGLSNQLLHHAGHLAKASRAGFSQIQIPNHFILQGTQTSDTNVVPSIHNSVPLEVVFDTEHLLHVLRSELKLDGQLVSLTPTGNDNGAIHTTAVDCSGLGESFQNAPGHLVQKVLGAFRPHQHHMQPLLDALQQDLPNDKGQGVCVHHRNGQDWMDHCQRWSSIPDKVYRGNCLQLQQQWNNRTHGREPLLENFKARALNDPNRWVYYCGDYPMIPTEITRGQGTYFSSIHSHHTLLKTPQGEPNSNAGSQAFHQHLQSLQSSWQEQHGLSMDLAKDSARDFWALLDYWVCERLPRFVGNSVSTFSALQIAQRQGRQAYWYNSQSVPLQSFWHGAYVVPLVYTYTELSLTNGKLLLQASIQSARRHLSAQNPIHVLYHGSNDTAFRSWLLSRNVTLHEHHPSWQADIEEMRQNGNSFKSHLFQHSGSYLGTWQRIDIPLFVEYEYVLLLDADTILQSPFDMESFGLDVTTSLAMSSELAIQKRKPANAGVTLMNIPYLRQTHTDFVAYILRHKATGGKFEHPSPSDQGAYLSYYQDSDLRFLEYAFNQKPYFAQEKRGPHQPAVPQKILHFHGPKPNDYVDYLLGGECNPAYSFLCQKSLQEASSSLCQALSAFAEASLQVDRYAYCRTSFADAPTKASDCQSLLESLADPKRPVGLCDDFPRFLMARARAMGALEVQQRQQQQEQQSSSTNAQLLRGTNLTSSSTNTSVAANNNIAMDSVISSLCPQLRQPTLSLGYNSSGWTTVYILSVVALVAVLIGYAPSRSSKQQQQSRRLNALLLLCFCMCCVNLFQSEFVMQIGWRHPTHSKNEGP